MEIRKQLLFLREFFQRERQIKITIEEKEVLEVRRFSKDRRKFCPLCSEVTLFLSIRDAAEIFHETVQSINILAAEGKIHVYGNAVESNLFCFNSIEKTLAEKPKQIKTIKNLTE